jgi:hypothetical protein
VVQNGGDAYFDVLLMSGSGGVAVRIEGEMGGQVNYVEL